MASYQILYWHDIPVQVRGRGAGGRASAPLPDRFQEAIDKAAMEAGLTGSDAYMSAFKWSEPQEREGAAQEVVDAVARELDEQYPQIEWRKTVAALKTAQQ